MQAIGPNEVSGLPAHVLLIHLTVVALPTAALATVLSAAWPAARRRLGIGTPLIALLALICVPITVSAGEWLAARIGKTPAIEHHEHLGHELLPWAIALFVVAAAEYAWFSYGAPRLLPASAEPSTSASGNPSPSTSASGRASTSAAGGARTPAAADRRTTAAIAVVATVLALIVAGGSVVQVYRIGDSGARAAWKGAFSETPLPATTP